MCAVNRLSKAIIIVLAGLVLVAVAASIAANLYIQSPRTQARIQEELGKALHIPLRITSTTITPWGGMRMSGITVPGNDGTLIEAKSFSADYKLLPLLHGKLVVGRMILDSPKIVWAQSADGKWKLPTLPETHKAPKEPSTAPKEPKDSSAKVSIGGLTILNGEIEMIDLEQQHFATATQVNMEYTIRHDNEVEGTFAADQVAWRDALYFNKVESKLSYTKTGDLSFTDLHGSIAQGTATGNVTFQTEKKDTPFKLNLHFEKVDLERLTAEGNWQPGQSSGTLAGTLELHGSTKDFDHSEGAGTLTLTDGQFRQLLYLQMIGQVLQIPELSDLHLSTAHAEFRIHEQHTYIDQLQLDSPDLQINAKGNARFDGRLSMEAQLSVSERLAGRLPNGARGIILNNFSPPDDHGRRSIAFDIGGRTDKPKTNLLDKVIGRQIGSQFEDLVSSIFGKKKKDKDKDDEKDKEKKKKKDRDKEKDKEPGADAKAPVDTVEAAHNQTAPPTATPSPGPAPSKEP